MNNHEDIPKRRGGEDNGLPDKARCPLLPLPLSEDSLSKSKAAGGRRKHGMLAFAVLLLLLAVGTIGFSYLSGGDSLVLPEDGDGEAAVTDEWRGAFDSKEIYENVLASAVSIRVGKRGSEQYCSGVVLDSEGVIATAIGDEAMLGSPMYVMPNGGGEYAVTSVQLDRECGLALLKIPAMSLNEATLSESTPQVGESVFSICASAADGKASLYSCDVSAVGTASENESSFELDRSDLPTGSPIFDEKGGLLAIAGKKSSDTQTPAVSVARYKACFKMSQSNDG